MTKELQTIQRRAIEQSISLPRPQASGNLSGAFNQLSGLSGLAASKLAITQGQAEGAEAASQNKGKPKKLAPGLTAATKAYNDAYNNMTVNLVSLDTSRQMDLDLIDVTKQGRLNSNTVAEYDALAKARIEGALQGVDPSLRAALALKLTDKLFSNQLKAAKITQDFNVSQLNKEFDLSFSQKLKDINESILNGDKVLFNSYLKDFESLISDKKALGLLDKEDEANLRESFDAFLKTADYTKRYFDSRIDNTEEKFLDNLFREKPGDLTNNQWETIKTRLLSVKSTQDKGVASQMALSAATIKNEITQSFLDGEPMSEDELKNKTIAENLPTTSFLALNQYRLTQINKLLNKNKGVSNLSNLLSQGKFIQANAAPSKAKNELYDLSVENFEKNIQEELGEKDFKASILEKSSIVENMGIDVPTFREELAGAIKSKSADTATSGAIAYKHLQDTSPRTIEKLDKEAKAIAQGINNKVKLSNIEIDEAVKLSQNEVLEKKDPVVIERVRRAKRAHPSTPGDRKSPDFVSTLDSEFKDLFGKGLDPALNAPAFAAFSDLYDAYASMKDNPSEALSLAKQDVQPVWGVSKYGEKGRLIQGPEHFFDYFESAQNVFDNQVILQSFKFVKDHEKARRESNSKLGGDGLIIKWLGGDDVTIPDRTTGDDLMRLIAVEMGLSPNSILQFEVNGKKEQWYIDSTPDTRFFDDGVLRYPVYRYDDFGNKDYIIDPNSNEGGLFTINFTSLDKYAPDTFSKLEDERQTQKALSAREGEIFEPRSLTEKILQGDIFDIERKRKAKHLAQAELEGGDTTRIDELKAVIQERRLGKPGVKEEIREEGLDENLPDKSPKKQKSLQGIKEASSKTDVDEDVLKAIAKIESNFNPDAKSKTSSASGLFQFTDSTWAEMVEKFGKKHNITKDMKNDPIASSIMAGEFIKQNKEELTKFLNREPTTYELYLAHFAGLSGAKRAIKALEKNPNAPVSEGFSKRAIESNKGLLKGTISQTIDRIKRKVQRALASI